MFLKLNPSKFGLIYFSKSFRLIESLLSKFFFSSIVRRVKFPEYVWT